MEIRPQPGAQSRFLSSQADICVYGGSAGSGKSMALLIEPLRHIHVPGFGGVLFRREAKELTMEGGLVSKAMSIYPYLGATYRSQPSPSFTFPSGAKISFGHLNQENEVMAWKGSEICYIAFDEVDGFSDFQVMYMQSRNRSTCGVRPYIRMSCNPSADSWLAKYLEWWIDQKTGYPIQERSGVIRYLVRVNGERMWADSREELVARYGCDYDDPKTVSFVPAKITDNPILLKKDPGYLSNLKGLSRVERARLLDGNWLIRAEAGMYFSREDAVIIDWKPDDSKIFKWVRSWDLAASEESDGRDPDWTVGILGGRKENGNIVIADMIRVRRKANDVQSLVRNVAMKDGRETFIVIPQDPGQAGKPIYEDEIVLMGDGCLKRLKEINVGDYVIGKDANSHKVLNVYIQGLLPTLKITTECGREIYSALDHPFLTPDGWVVAEQLTTLDTLALLCKANVDVSSNCLRKKEEFRLAGYFIGDGCTSKSKKSISCHGSFVCNDEYQLKDFIACVESIGGSVVSHKSDISFGTKGLQQWFRDTELNGKTAYDKRVPKWVFTAPTDFVVEFIGAYFACDGYISKSGDEVVFYSVSKELLKDIQHLLLRVGISSTIKRKNGKYLETRHVSYLLRLRQQDDGYRRFANRVPVFHSMKSQRLNEMASISRFRRFDETYLPDRIISIEDGGLLPCRCISVEDSESFVVDDIVVHNSQIESYRKVLNGYTVISRAITKNKLTVASSGADSPAALWQRGCIELVRANWNKDMLDELDAFPTPKVHDDIVDCLSACVRNLPGHAKPDYSQSGLNGRFKEVRSTRRVR